MVTFELIYKSRDLFPDVKSYHKSFLEFKSQVLRIISHETCPRLFKKPQVSDHVRDGNYYLKIRTCCYEYSKRISELLKDYKQE
jgi:hypothetical protein